MAIFPVLFEEVELTLRGQQILAEFEVNFTYSTAGHMHRCRVEEVEPYDHTVTIRDIETDEEIEVHIPGRDDLGRQVEAAIWRDEDRIYEAATDDLNGEYCNAMELRRDAQREEGI